MKNKQNAEPLRRESSTLDVHSIFFTLQGEAIHTGRPAVFIRLAGCNLQCPNCDTDYTSTRRTMSIADIVEEVWKHNTRLVVITGGEPFRQQFSHLIEVMPNHEFQVETNGLLCPEWAMALLNTSDKFKVVISPMTEKIDSRWETVRHSSIMYKYVMSYLHVDAFDGLPLSILGKANRRPARPWSGNHACVYLQPEDTGKTYANRKSIDACVKSCMTYGYTLCLQTQKIVNLP